METALRVAALYVFIFIGLRLLGKREFGQLSPTELVTLLLIPEIVSQALTGQDYSLTNAFVGVATLLLLVFATSLLSHRSRRFDCLLNGQPTILVARGQLLEANCNRERISAHEVFSEMHKAGLDSLSAVKWAILEVDGKISIIPQREGE